MATAGTGASTRHEQMRRRFGPPSAPPAPSRRTRTRIMWMVRSASSSMLLVTVGLSILLLWATLPFPVAAVRKLEIAVPLQALTIWDPEFKEEVAADDDGAATRRARFLPRFRAGLGAEAAVRQQLRDEQLRAGQQQAAASSSATGGPPLEGASKESNKNWAAQAAARDRQRAEAHERLVEQAYDQAVAPFDPKARRRRTLPKKKNANQFQFVGIVNSAAETGNADGSPKPPITWYARPKPARAQWSLRLVHVNRAAVLKDLYDGGQIDVLARYQHTGARDPQTGQPVVEARYAVRERSWKNLWNFNLKHAFTDSSGMYCRERRLPRGLYTDGATVYEASYRYRDGRNGMHRVSSLQDFFKSRSVPARRKERVAERLAGDAPDVVLED